MAEAPSSLANFMVLVRVKWLFAWQYLPSMLGVFKGYRVLLKIFYTLCFCAGWSNGPNLPFHLKQLKKQKNEATVFRHWTTSNVGW